MPIDMRTEFEVRKVYPADLEKNVSQKIGKTEVFYFIHLS